MMRWVTVGRGCVCVGGLGHIKAFCQGENTVGVLFDLIEAVVFNGSVYIESFFRLTAGTDFTAEPNKLVMLLCVVTSRSTVLVWCYYSFQHRWP